VSKLRLEFWRFPFACGREASAIEANNKKKEDKMPIQLVLKDIFKQSNPDQWSFVFNAKAANDA
jgi:hypothetical protein